MYTGMRKSKHNNGSTKRSMKFNTSNKTENLPPKLDSIDEDDRGFGAWIRSSDGVENMKLFVIANSIVLLMTLAYPNFQLLIEIISDALYGPDAII